MSVGFADILVNPTSKHVLFMASLVCENVCFPMVLLVLWLIRPLT